MCEYSISLSLQICNVTGKPCYMKYKEGEDEPEKIYEIPTLHIPAHLKTYLSGDRRSFFPYMWYFHENKLGDSSSISRFLEHYPLWENIKEQTWHLYDWTEENHKEFKELLILCEQTRLPFEVKWWRPSKD